MCSLIFPPANSAATRIAVLDGVGIGAAVGDDANALDAQQRRSAVFGIIHALLEILKRGPRKHVSDFARDGGFERLAQHLVDHVHQALAHLQRDVSDEPVANNHVDFAGVDVAALHVSDEMDGQGFEQRRGRAGQFVAFVLFFADGEQARRAAVVVRKMTRE